MFEHFDHTADLGLRVRARTLEELFAEAGRGLFQMIVLNLHDVEPRQEHRVELQSDSLEYLLFDWLDELLYAFESKRLLLSQFQVEIQAEASPHRVNPLRPTQSVGSHPLAYSRLQSWRCSGSFSTWRVVGSR